MSTGTRDIGISRSTPMSDRTTVARGRCTLLLLTIVAGALNADIGPSGLDTRPSNLTCLAPPRPTGGAGIASIEPFSPSPSWDGNGS